MNNWIEIEAGGKTFRTRERRTLWAQGELEKSYARNGAISLNDWIIADCEIFDRETQKWREVIKEDLKEIDREEGINVLFKRLNEVREAEGFQRTQPKEQKATNGS